MITRQTKDAARQLARLLSSPEPGVTRTETHLLAAGTFQLLDEIDRLTAENDELGHELDQSQSAAFQLGYMVNHLKTENELLSAEMIALRKVADAAEELLPVARACIASPREPLTNLHVALRAAGRLK